MGSGTGEKESHGINKSLSRGWAKSKEMMSRSKGDASASASETEGDADDATHKVSATAAASEVRHIWGKTKSELTFSLRGPGI
jgi:hypothetical protein